MSTNLVQREVTVVNGSGLRDVGRFATLEWRIRYPRAGLCPCGLGL
jgi:hypothetical protein